MGLACCSAKPAHHQSSDGRQFLQLRGTRTFDSVASLRTAGAYGPTEMFQLP